VALAQRAERGRRCAAELLDPDGHAAQTDLAAAWTAWQATDRARTEEAVVASRAIAETRPGDQRRAEAERTYRAARSALGTLAQRRDVTDAQRALGPPPDVAAPALRRDWYRRLAEAFADHR
jgi:hypothetical protein